MAKREELHAITLRLPKSFVDALNEETKDQPVNGRLPAYITGLLHKYLTRKGHKLSAPPTRGRPAKAKS